MEFIKQQRLMLWKHWTIRKRQPVILSLEFLWPLAIFLIITSVRHLFPPEPMNDCVYRARAMPSAGLLPFMQSFLCNLDNKCENMSSYEEIPVYKNGKISHLLNKVYPLIGQQEVNTILSQLPTLLSLASHFVKSLSTSESKNILSHSFTVGELFRDTDVIKQLMIKHNAPPESIQAFFDAKIDLGQLVRFVVSSSNRNTTCRAEDLMTFLKFENPIEALIILESICENIHDPLIIKLLAIQLNVRPLLEKGVVLLKNLKSDDLALALQSVGKIVDGLQSIPILESLASAPIGTETQELSAYLQHAMEFLKTLKDFNLDLDFLGELMDDIERVAGPGEVINHLKAVGKHIHRIISWSRQGTLKVSDLAQTSDSGVLDNETLQQDKSKPNIISTKELAQDLQDMLSHITFVGNKFGKTLRDAFPAFDITWKIATTAISAILLPDRNNTGAFVSGLASVFQTFPGYLPVDMRMPGLYFITAIEALLKVGVNITRNIADVNQILLKDFNLRHWEEFSLTPASFISLANILNSKNILKILSEEPHELHNFVCNLTLAENQNENETDKNLENLRRFMCDLPVKEITDSLAVIGNREVLIYQMQNTLIMNGESDVDTAFRNTIRTVTIVSWELLELFQNLTYYAPIWKRVMIESKIVTQEDPQWRTAILNLRAASYNLVIDLYADVIGNSLEQISLNSRNDRVTNNVGLMINLIAEEFLKVPNQMFNNLVSYWPWVIQTFLDSFQSKEKIAAVVSQQKWAAVMCNETLIDQYLLISDEIHSQQFLNFLCDLSTYVEKDILNVNWFDKESVKQVRDVIDNQGLNYTKADWIKTFVNVREMLSKHGTLVSISIDNIQQIEDIYKKFKLVISTMNITNVLKVSMNAFTTIMEFVDRQMETVIPWGWKQIKALISVLDIFVQYTNQELKRILTENKVETGSLTFGLRNFTDLGRKIIRAFPEYTNALTKLFSSRLGDFIGRIFKVVRSKATPCENLSTTDVIDFSDEGREVILELERTACSNWKFIISEIIQYPMMFKMLWKFREATRDKDLPINWTEMLKDVHQLIDYSNQMSKFNGAIFPDVEGFSIENANNAINGFIDTMNLNNTKKGLRFAMVIVDASIPLLENLMKPEWLFSNMSIKDILVKSFDEYDSEEQSELSYTFVKTIMKTLDILFSEMTAFYQDLQVLPDNEKQPSMFTNLPALFGEVFQSFPDYINSFMELFLRGDFQILLDKTKGSKLSSFAGLCDLIVSGDQKQSLMVTKDTVLPTLCKLLNHPDKYFSSEPFVYSWMIKAIKKLTVLWENEDQSSVIVHFMDIADGIGFTMSETNDLVGNRLEVKKEFNDLVGNARWNEVVGSVARLIVKLRIDNWMQPITFNDLPATQSALNTLPINLVCITHGTIRALTSELKNCVEYNPESQQKSSCLNQPLLHNSPFYKFWKLLDDHLIDIVKIAHYTITKNPSKIKLLLDASDPLNLTCSSAETFFTVPHNDSLSLSIIINDLCEIEWNEIIDAAALETGRNCLPSTKSLGDLSDDFADFINQYFTFRKLKLPKYMSETSWIEVFTDATMQTANSDLNVTLALSNLFDKLFRINDVDTNGPSLQYLNMAANTLLKTAEIVNTPFNDNIWKGFKVLFESKPQTNKLFNFLEDIPKLASTFLNTAMNTTKLSELLRTIWTFDSQKRQEDECKNLNLSSYFEVSQELDVSFDALKSFMCTTNWTSFLLELNSLPTGNKTIRMKRNFQSFEFITSVNQLVNQLIHLNNGKIGVFKANINDLPWTKKGEWRSAVEAIDKLQQNLKDPNLIADVAVEYLSIIEGFPLWNQIKEYLQFMNLQSNAFVENVKAITNHVDLYTVFTNVTAMKDLVFDVHKGIKKSSQLLRQYAVIREIQYFSAFPNDTAIFCKSTTDLQTSSVEWTVIETFIEGQMTLKQLFNVFCNVQPDEWLNTLTSDYDIKPSNVILLIKTMMKVLPKNANYFTNGEWNNTVPFNWSMLMNSFRSVNHFLQNPPSDFYPEFKWNYWNPVFRTFGMVLPDIIHLSGETMCPILPRVDYDPIKELFLLVDNQLMNAEKYEKLICDLPLMNLSSIYHRLKNDVDLIETFRLARIYIMNISRATVANKYSSCQFMFDALSKIARELNEIIVRYVEPSFKASMDKCFQKDRQAVIVKEIDKYSKLISKGMPLLNFPNITSFTDSMDIKSLVETLLEYMKYQVPVFFPLKNVLTSNNTLNQILVNTPAEELLTDGLINLNMLAATDFKKEKLVNIFCDSIKFSKFIKLSSGLHSDSKRLVAENIFCPNNDRNNGIEVSNMFLKTMDINKINNILPRLRMENLLSWNLVVSVGRNIGKLGTSFVGIKEAMGNVDFSKAFDDVSIKGIIRLLLPMIHITSLQKLSNGVTIMAEVLSPIISGSSFEDKLVDVSDGLMGLYWFFNNDLRNETIAVKNVVTDTKPLSDYLLSVGYPESNLNAILYTTVNFSVLLFDDQISKLEDIICDLNIMPVLFNLKSDLTSAGLLHTVLCEQQHLDKINEFLDIIFNHLNIISILKNEMHLFMNPIIKQLNLNPVNVQKALDALYNAQEIFPVVTRTLYSLQMDTNIAKMVSNLNPSELARGEISTSLISSFGKMLCGHSIRTFEEYFRLLQTTNNRPPPEKEKLELQSLPSDFCQAMYKQVAYRPAGSVIWGFLKPFLRGKLLFSPDNEFTRKLISQINITFDSMANSVEMLHEWTAGFIQLQLFIEEQLDDMEALISLPIPNSISIGLFGPTITKSMSNISGILNEMGNPQKLLGATSALSKGLQCFEMNRFVGYKTEEQMEKSALALKKTSSFLAAIVFDNFSIDDIKHHQSMDKINVLSGLPKHIQYKIRMDIDDVPSTKLKKERFWKPGPEDNFIENLRYLRGFVLLQDLVDRAIIKMQTGSQNSTLPGTFVQQFPYPCYSKDEFGYFLRANVPAVTTLAWIFIVAIFVREVVLDRELMVQQVMVVMGLKPWISWVAWFSNCIFVMLLTNVGSTLILKYGGVFPNSDPLLLFLFLFTFSFSTIMYCYLVSIWFQKATIAAIAAVLLYLVSYLPFIVVLTMEAQLTFAAKLLMNLVMSTAFSQGCVYIARFEEQTEGIQWSNIWKSPIFGDDMNLAWTCIMMAIDAIIYYAIAAYFSTLISVWQQNAKKKWYMIFYPIFSIIPGLKSHSEDQKFKHIDPVIRREPFGNVTKQNDPKSRVGISIRNLSKMYFTSKANPTVAVEDLTMDLYEGNITTLLGQSGSGKTTIINMLIGLTTPKSGYASIYDRDIATEFEEIRKDLGVCPQYNILFDLMTVREHLEFFGRLKGSSKSIKLEDDINNMLDAMKLKDKENERACNLSGGTKRRLSVAIAFVGGSRTIILDEPTSGVDPIVRRSIWELVVRSKGGRTILITTHHMDEADILSDAVLIIHHGKTLCHGTPMNLKLSFGSGYLLNVFKSNSDQSIESASMSKPVSSSSNGKDLLSSKESNHSIYGFAKFYIPNAYLLEDNNTSLVLCLPYTNEDGSSNKYAEFFKNLEEQKQRLGVVNYSISSTTLEQVFMNICLQSDAGLPITPQGQKILVLAKNMNTAKDKGLKKDIAGGGTNEFNFNIGAIPNVNKRHKSRKGCEPWLAKSLYQVHYTLCKGATLKNNQFKWLLIKRVHHYSRNWRAFVTCIVLPCVFVAMAMGFTLIRPPVTHSSPSLLLTPNIYGPYVSSFIKVNPGSVYGENLSRMMKLPPGIGTTCMSDKPKGSYPACTAQGIVEHHSVTKQQCNCEIPGTTVCDGKTLSFTYNKDYTNTTDIVYDLSTGNVTDWLMATHLEFIEQRYGGWVFGATRPPEAIPGSAENVIGWFNNKGYHAMPSYINSINNAILRGEVLNGRNDTASEYGISTYNHPLHLSQLQLGMEALMHHVADVGIAIIFLVAFSFIPAGFVMYLVKERVQGEKRLQHLSGAGPLLYWSVAAFFDIIMLTIPVGLAALIITIFDLPIYMYGHNFVATLAMLFMFGWATTPLMYILEKFFVEPSLASIILFCTNVFIGVNTTVCTLLFYLFQKNEAMQVANNVLHYLFLIFPQFALAGGLIELTKNYIQAEVFMRFGDDTYTSPFSMNILGLNLIILGIEGVVFFAFNLILEYAPNYLSWITRKQISFKRTNEDANVKQEREKVSSSNCTGDLIRFKDLTKVFNGSMGETIAVNNLCLSVPKGECFGLLGVNGAGKTTTFHLLTGEIIPTSGEIFYKNKKISSSNDHGSRNVGYCPQSNAVDDLLSAEESLSVYAGLKGIPDVDVPLAVYKAIVQFQLENDAQNMAKTYSNGTKRKLCAAIAVLGNPELILMDEPTTGMDPTTRRLVWQNIHEITRDNRSVILTSHNMEECDALCTRLAIMKDGQFQCLGSPNYLKEKFGDDYTVSVIVKEEYNQSDIASRIKSQFPSAVNKVGHGNTVDFIIPSKTVELGELFQYLENMKLETIISDFSISRITLDQIFVDFVLRGGNRQSLNVEVNHCNNVNQDVNIECEPQVRDISGKVESQVTQF